MTWYDILISYGIPAITIILSFIFTFTKNKKVKAFAGNLLSVTEQAKVLIVEAEAFTNYTGSEKKNYVMSRLFKFVFENKIKTVTENDLSDIIESEISLTNQVNVLKKTSTDTLSELTVKPQIIEH